jgi:thiosulfate/3-mercaptopyruvate sulfurtransferase
MVKRAFVTMGMVFIFLLSVQGAFAAWTNPDLLFSVDQVEKIIGNPQWVILDCRDQANYEKGHLPGAVILGKASAPKILRDGTARVFQDLAKYEKIFGQAGISNDKEVLVYSDLKSKIMADAFLTFWVLEYLGHKKVHLLDGGLDAWVRAGKKVETAPSKITPALFTVKADRTKLASSEEVLEHATGKEKNNQLVDCRTREEFDGYDIRALRGGHIPKTTRNISHVTFFEHKKDEKSGKDIPTGLLSEAAVNKALEGLDKGKRTFFLCQTGTRSTFGYFVSRLSGFSNPANYDDSWIVWANNFYKNYPVENEQWIDLSRITELENKVKELEDKIKSLEGKK